ncbi:BrnT family toxin [Lonepinella sp. BR2271]|uniref:BrnT family toxin n=1 Tax=Lonepinella sp. BR2271 TaxID=3434550 RepID=UPI003F6DDA12
MQIEYDCHKSRRNVLERGLSFELVRDVDWNSAVIRPDTRFDYPEPRFIALGFIHKRLHVIVFTPVGEKLRVISLRKANKREIRDYERTLNQ